MYKKLIYCLLFSLFTIAAIAQEEERQIQNRVVPEGVPPPSSGPVKNSKAPKKSNRKVEKPYTGRTLIAEQRQKKRKHTWQEGDKLIYRLKDDKQLYRAEINKIIPGKLMLDSVEVKISDVVMVKANLFSLMKEKSKGFGQIAIGIPIVALGTYVIVLSYESIDNQNPTIVASALGLTLGAAIDLYGLSFLKKGLKVVFASRKMKKEKGWVIKIR